MTTPTTPETTPAWLSPVEGCDLCQRPLTPMGVMIDGSTTVGPWALMCPTCHDLYGKGLGTGCGQRYTLADGRWLKTGG